MFSYHISCSISQPASKNCTQWSQSSKDSALSLFTTNYNTSLSLTDPVEPGLILKVHNLLWVMTLLFWWRQHSKRPKYKESSVQWCVLSSFGYPCPFQPFKTCHQRRPALFRAPVFIVWFSGISYIIATKQIDNIMEGWLATIIYGMNSPPCINIEHQLTYL